MARIFGANKCKACHKLYVPEFCKGCGLWSIPYCASCHNAIYEHQKTWRSRLNDV